MTHIRPHKIFDLVPESSIYERIAHVKIPYRTENWLIETFLLIAAMRIVKPKRIFEFGTFRGATTLNLALNAPWPCKIFTFDLAPGEQVEQDPLHAEISRKHFERNGHMEFDDVTLRHGIEIEKLEGNSLTFDPTAFVNSMDLVFVDGGHDEKTLAADSINAFRMINSSGCIVWHDYGNKEYPDVKQYLDGEVFPLLHVEDSRLAFWFENHAIREALSR